MSILFSSGKIGRLELPNRLVRSATAERMADDNGRPRPQLKKLYEELARGGVGLIITGHMYVHPSGKAHEEMTGIYSDDLVPDLAELAQAVHAGGGLVVTQINHGGMFYDKETVDDPIAPSAVDNTSGKQTAREMSREEIKIMIDAYGQAARRAKEAGFDGVQIHGAHGYLISQFLSPVVNLRKDEWGGDIHTRMKFLIEVYSSIRKQVGNDFPVLIKLGVKDGVETGLRIEESLEVVRMLEEIGMNGIEISGGYKYSSSRKGIRTEDDEAFFLPLAKKIRPITKVPLLLVGGMRSRKVMERILEKQISDFISICRPLITEPDFPNRMRLGVQEKSRCISSNNCWPEEKGVGIKCKCPLEKVSTTKS